MTSPDVLTTDDLDDIGHYGHPGRAEPQALLDRLVRAVDEGRIADERDRGYALSLAAGIAEEDLKDLDRALALIERGIVEDRASGESELDSRADRARLLHLTGREDEALAELTELRPLLESEPGATHVTEVLEEIGRADLAERWLTEAVRTLLTRTREPGGDTLTGDEQEQVAAMLFGLLRQRHRLRHELDLGHDDLDELADRLDVAAEQAADRAAAETSGLLYWPRNEFNGLLLRWPQLADQLGGTWDEHRTGVERELVALAGEGVPGLALVPGSAEAYAGFVTAGDRDPADEDTLDDYADGLADQADAVSWPPGRNEPCWCGSGSKYKKCCLPRSR
ncbi:MULTISPECIES: SEC-C domain-containing protein [Micromonospora]|uniref:SEC-C motif-containing protein n=1 Tax=Micromonospora yangpuensis TaxID=683228 RepID=A0A1C6UZU5_9ACTN|nr:SEC-C domain-containing protein [Micromonospora yangpuensis]GGL95982.1 hypothetical protein GCM10012279_11740 [Micromonospora yangpuensis]SCL59330.1 SEC-C motif-containing protein [Micromonospora yangpuensis]